MKLRLDTTPDLAALMAAEIKAGEKAVSTATREAGTGLKTAWRGQITGAGLGQRLAKSIRSQSYPKAGTSLNAAALVWSKAPTIISAHATGPLIRSKTGFWLAIPTEAAGRGFRGGRITPGEWERRRGLRLRFVYRRRGPEPSGGRRSAEQGRPHGRLALEDRPWADHDADLPARAAGQAAQAARPRPRRRTGARQRAGQLIVANWVDGQA